MREELTRANRRNRSIKTQLRFSIFQRKGFEMSDVKYTKAVQKLDEIIAKIESEEIDVDELSVKVKEAVELIKVCKAKIEKAELEVKKVVENFDLEKET